jgi:HlyD family secretion protein
MKAEVKGEQAMTPRTFEKDLSVLRIDRSEVGPPDSGGKKPWKLAAMLVAIMVAVLTTFWVVRSFATAPTVRVARVAVNVAGGVSAVALTASGYIIAHHTIEVGSKIVGKVAWIGVEAGDKVKKGQVLVRLDDTEYRAQLEQARANWEALKAKFKEEEAGSRPQEIAAARATTAQARANFLNAAVTLKRTEALFQEKIDSSAQRDTALAQYNATKAQLNNAAQNYELVKIGPRIEDINYARAQAAQAKANMDYEQTMLDSTLIRAPIDGTILERDVEVGELISNMNFGGDSGVKASVVSIANLHDLLVELDINENDFSKVSMRQECTLAADAYPDRSYKGYVYEISPEADRQKATIQVKVKILNPDDYLKPEMNAHVSFLASGSRGQQPEDSLTVPSSAVVQRNGQDAVFVVDGSHVRLRVFQAGRQIDGQTTVLDGLGPNDEVVVQGQDALKPGERVKTEL